jgi:hypothetical protein
MVEWNGAELEKVLASVIVCSYSGWHRWSWIEGDGFERYSKLKWTKFGDAKTQF